MTVRFCEIFPHLVRAACLALAFTAAVRRRGVNRGPPPG